MEYIREASENEMVALYLQTEVNSDRYRNRILKIVAELNASEKIVLEPDLNLCKENELRKNILSIFRGYGKNEEIFDSFPKDVRWVWVNLSKDDLYKVKYINYSYWNKLSGGSRLAKDAAVNIRSGIEVYGVKNDGFIASSKYLKDGGNFPPMILVADNEDQIIALEGHFRLTVYMLEPDFIPDRLRTMLGYTEKEELEKWGLY